jgi:ribonuclease HII
MDTCKEVIAGMDEVGMGCLAGPLVVCVAVFPKEHPQMLEVVDSKKLTSKKRESLVLAIREAAICYGLGWASPPVVDSAGIAESWQRAASEALRSLYGKISVGSKTTLIVDGVRSPSDKAFFETINAEPKADANFWQVSAASILAKVARDTFMRALSRTYPEYGWDKNSGYGTEDHIEAIKRLGPVPGHHRLSFLKKI